MEGCFCLYPREILVLNELLAFVPEILGSTEISSKSSIIPNLATTSIDGAELFWLLNSSDLMTIYLKI